MQRTIFSTPFITPLLRMLSNGWLKLSGWRVVASDIPGPPFIFIGAPHTSNWDFFLLLGAVFHLGLDISWMGKHTLFPPILGGIMRWMGGIPVNRSKAHNVVAKTAEMIRKNPETILCISPEGTRSKVMRWKSGFYHIAEQAGVPILLAAIDAEQKQLRLIGEFKPTGNLEQDMRAIQEYYRDFRGLHPKNAFESH